MPGNGVRQPRLLTRRVLQRSTTLSFVWLAGLAYGYFVHRNHWPPYDAALFVQNWALSLRQQRPPGLWSRRPGDRLSAAQRETIERLEAIGYVTGDTVAPAGLGVIVYDEHSAHDGVNLYSSGHGPEALLIDMEGRLLHRWGMRYEDAFPEQQAPAETDAAYFRRVHLYPNGDLLVLFEGLGIVRLDRASRLRWAIPNRAHHDVDVAPDGSIYVLTRTAHVRPDVHPSQPILNFVEILTPTGRLVDRFSILEAVRSSNHSALMNVAPGDIFHTNSLQLLDGRHSDRLPAFARGALLVSLHTLNAVAVLDAQTRGVTWALKGMTRRQHDPSLLDSGNLRIFDNRVAQEGTRIVEIDPRTQQMLWRYPAVSDPGLYSDCCGTAQRLPNGNTLMTISGPGLALESTPNGEIVWRFESPHRAGSQGEFVAMLTEMQRHARGYVSPWLGERGGVLGGGVPAPGTAPSKSRAAVP